MERSVGRGCGAASGRRVQRPTMRNGNPHPLSSPYTVVSANSLLNAPSFVSPYPPFVLAYCGLTPEPPLAVQTSIVNLENEEGKPNLGTLPVPSFGFPGARKLEAFDASTFRPGPREFERQNYLALNFNSSPKMRLLQKSDFPRFPRLCLLPAGNREQHKCVSASGGLGIYLQSVLRTAEKVIQKLAIALPKHPLGSPLSYTTLLFTICRLFHPGCVRPVVVSTWGGSEPPPR